jgi:hypothetical protein
MGRGLNRNEATEVTVSFEPRPYGTLVSIVHGGWDRITRGPGLRDRTVVGWAGPLPHFESAVQRMHDH